MPCQFFTNLILLHDKMTATVLFNGTETQTFTIRTGVKQGCVIVPTLFTVYLCAILFLLRDRRPHGVELDYRFDGMLFNLSRLKAKTKVVKTAVINLQYADDCAILAHSAKTFQTSLGLFKEAYQSLDINIRKNKVINLLLASMQDLPKLKYLEKSKKMLNTSRIYEVTCPRKPPARQKLNTVSAAPARPSGNCATEYLMTTTSGKRWRWWSTKPFVLINLL